MRWVLVVCALCAMSGTDAAPAEPAAGSFSELHFQELREMLEHLDKKLDVTADNLDKRVTEVKNEVAEALLEQRKSILDLMGDKMDLAALTTKQSVLEIQEKGHISNDIQNDEPNVSISNMTSLSAMTEALCTWSAPNAARAALTSMIKRKVDAALQATVPDVIGYPDDVCPGSLLTANYDPDDVDLERPETSFRQVDYCEDGWFVFLRRQDGSVDFSRPWEEYAAGFGDRDGEFWLGNRELHRLTTRETHRLRVETVDSSGEVKVAEFAQFAVDAEKDNFTLHVGPLTLGADSAGNSLSSHNNKQFSTIDRDNDSHNSSSCARSYKGGFWYGSCHSANPTGQYLLPGTISTTGVCWRSAYNEYRSLKGITLKLRPVAHLRGIGK